jgi:protein gp37
VLTTLVDLRENHGTEAEPRWVRTITVRCETHGAGLAQWGIGKERPAGRVGNLLEPA